MKSLRFGLVVNPFAGIGGSVALKGSDGPEIRAAALARGAIQKAALRTQTALKTLANHQDKITWLTAAGEMGETVLKDLGYAHEIVYQAESSQTEAMDTQEAVKKLLDANIDLLVFAGGDGTARDVYLVLQQADLPVVGIPAGVKIHSGVYAITPSAAGQVLNRLVQGELTTLREADVMDIDESAFREGVVRARRYGALSVPNELEYMQAVKVGGQESEALVLTDIAADIIENMEDDALYIMGSGSTVAVIMETLGLENTLLGVDLVVNEACIAHDVTAQQILETIPKYNQVYLVITLIGGQGHLFGRGNQQLSPEVLRLIKRSNIQVVATKEKLQSLAGRPLIVDTGDERLDQALAGLIQVTTGYHDTTLVKVG